MRRDSQTDDETIQPVPPQVVLEATAGRGLERIVVRIDRTEPVDAGLALLRRLLPTARQMDKDSRGKASG